MPHLQDREAGAPAFTHNPGGEQDTYPRIEPGIYSAQCIGVHVYRHPRIGRFVAQLHFVPIHDHFLEPLHFKDSGRESPIEVIAFLNLADGEKRSYERRGSRYRAAWLIANNGMPPGKRQLLSARIFKGKIFTVAIQDCTKRLVSKEDRESVSGLSDADQRLVLQHLARHPECDVYSRVSHIVALGPKGSTNQSFNQPTT